MSSSDEDNDDVLGAADPKLSKLLKIGQSIVATGIKQNQPHRTLEVRPSDDVRGTKRKRSKQSKTDGVASRFAERRISGAFCQQEIECCMCPALRALSFGASIAGNLELKGYRVVVEGARLSGDAPSSGKHFKDSSAAWPMIEHAIGWQRRRMEAPDVLASTANHEPVILLVWHGDRLADRILSGGLDALEADARSARSVLPPGTRILAAIVSMPEALLALGAHQRGKAVGLGGAGQGRGHSAGLLTMHQVEDAIAGWYVHCGVEARLVDNEEQLAVWVAALTRAVAEQPFRTRPTALAAVHKVRASGLQDLLGEGGALETGAGAAETKGTDEGEGEGGEYEEDPGGGHSSSSDSGKGGDARAKAGKGRGPENGAPKKKKARFNGGGAAAAQAAAGRRAAAAKKQDPRAVFYCQLQMIPGLSAAMAVNVVRRYPTMRVLMETYDALGPLPSLPPFVEVQMPLDEGTAGAGTVAASGAGDGTSGTNAESGDRSKRGRRKAVPTPLEAGLAARRGLLEQVLSAGKQRRSALSAVVHDVLCGVDPDMPLIAGGSKLGRK